ncbi:hypothetical protein SLJ66_001986 [Escherichia coli]|nr:hypothetical protein [Escherichia coli]
MTEKLYATRDIEALDDAGNHYYRNIMAMTSEGLDSKSDIAAELGFRDMQITELSDQVRLLTEQRDAVVVECQSKKSALEAILEHCPVNHPHIDAACAAMIAYDSLHCVKTPATDDSIAALRAEVLPPNIAEIIDSGDLETICYESERSYAEDFRLSLYNFRQLRESKGANHE